MGIRSRTGSWLVALSLIVGVLVLGSPATASVPALTLSSKAQHPRARVALHGTGFGGTEKVDISFDTIPVASSISDGAGHVTGKFRVPASAVPGDHTVTAVGRESGLQAQATFAVSTDWQGFHFDLRNRYNPYENVLDPSTVGGLTEVWTFASAGGIESSPAVVNGVVYVGSDDGNVYALDASAGAELWSFATGGAVESSPTVVDGVLYVGSDSNKVFALDASTGTQLWAITREGRVLSSPTVASGIVLVGSFEDSFEDRRLLALDASTGAELWSLDAWVESSPAVAKGVAFVTTDDDFLYALDAETGSVVWRYVMPNSVMSSPAVVNGVVYVTLYDDGTVYAFDATIGALLWVSFPLHGAIDTSPAVANGAVYAGTSQDWFYAINASTGTERWARDFHEQSSFIRGSPAVANGVVYFGSDDSNVYALDAGTGQRLWHFNTRADVQSSPAVVNGRVYVGSSDGVLHAFGLPSG